MAVDGGLSGNGCDRSNSLPDRAESTAKRSLHGNRRREMLADETAEVLDVFHLLDRSTE